MVTHENNNLNENQQNHSSLEIIYGKYYDNLVQFAEGLLKSNLYAQDIIQDVFVGICKQEIYFISEKLMVNYIYRSVYNRCVDILRHKQQIQRYGEIYAEEYKTDMMPIANEILYKELSAIIDKRIDNLPPRCKLIFLMKYENQQTNPEISKTLGLSLRTVENQVFIARSVLRNYLQPYLCS